MITSTLNIVGGKFDSTETFHADVLVMLNGLLKLEGGVSPSDKSSSSRSNTSFAPTTVDGTTMTLLC